METIINTEEFAYAIYLYNNARNDYEDIEYIKDFNESIIDILHDVIGNTYSFDEAIKFIDYNYSIYKMCGGEHHVSNITMRKLITSVKKIIEEMR